MKIKPTEERYFFAILIVVIAIFSFFVNKAGLKYTNIKKDTIFLSSISQKFETIVTSLRLNDPNFNIFENLTNKEKLFIYNPLLETKNEYTETITNGGIVSNYTYSILSDNERVNKIFLKVNLNGVKKGKSCSKMLLGQLSNFTYKTITINDKDMFLRDKKTREFIQDACTESKNKNNNYINLTLTTYSY